MEIRFADAETLVVSIKPIIEAYIRETSNIVHITINGENISIYDYTHYVEDKGFVSAEVLWIVQNLLIKIGMQLYRENLVDKSVKVYNSKVN